MRQLDDTVHMYYPGFMARIPLALWRNETKPDRMSQNETLNQASLRVSNKTTRVATRWASTGSARTVWQVRYVRPELVEGQVSANRKGLCERL